MLAASLCLSPGGTVFAVNFVETAEPETAPQSGEAAKQQLYNYTIKIKELS